MYDYMVFLIVGVVILGVGILIGRNLAQNEAKQAKQDSALDQHKALDNVSLDNMPPDTTESHENNRHEHGDNPTAEHDKSADLDSIVTQLQNTQEAFTKYRQLVQQHLSDTEAAIDTLTSGYHNVLSHVLDSNIKTPTNKLVSDLTQSYQQIFSRLSDSASALTDDSTYLEHLAARRDKAVLINTQQRVKKS